MAGETHYTIDHDRIRAWTEARGGHPAAVAGTGTGDDPGILRLDFPGGAGDDALEPLSWEQWFAKFDDSLLALAYQEELKDGSRSNFNRLVDRRQHQTEMEG